MRKSLAIAAVAAACGLFGVVEAQALPGSPAPASDNAMVQQVRGGCGAGWHRGPYGGCRRNTAAYGPRGANGCWFRGGVRVCR